jgi:drug/metabolite transporter (DMT)-like permease
MAWLIGASLIWGLSFGLIKGLAQDIDPFTLGLYRSVVAAFVFVPWFRVPIKSPRMNQGGHELIDDFISEFSSAFFCGFVQIGLMYGPYLKSFQYLKSYEVALFTMTTPLIAGALMRPSERSSWSRLLCSISLATLGGCIVAWGDIVSDRWIIGVLLVQAANSLFVIGSLLWSRLFSKEAEKRPRTQARLMTPYFMGASAASLVLIALFSSPFPSLSRHHVFTIIWLGVMASGVGFFMWNLGVLRVQATTLAVANNLKIPLAILISLLVFGESANGTTLSLGLAIIMLALWIAGDQPRTKSHS